MLFFAASLLAAISAVGALRPENISICDYYTPIVLGKENSPASQYELMLTLTHTFILGNYTKYNVGIKVAGIAGPAKFKGHDVNLLPYFTGGYNSTNLGTGHGVATNWLDSGAAGTLLANKPANSTSSYQYQLLTHVYQYFGTFYGCSQQGISDDFPAYQGSGSMYEVHKYMDTNTYEQGYFNEQIVLAGQSLGFEDPDVEYTRKGLDATFSNRCSPAAAVIPASEKPSLQSICIAEDCPLDPNATCSAYPDNGLGQYPIIANETLLSGVPKENDTAPAASGSGSTSGSPTASSAAATDSTATGSAAIASSTGGADSARWVSASSMAISSIAAVVASWMLS